MNENQVIDPINENQVIDPIKFLAHVMKHLVNGQPAEYSQVTTADNDAMDIVTDCKEWIRAEERLSSWKLRNRLWARLSQDDIDRKTAESLGRN
jgi:hypothetical protein